MNREEFYRKFIEALRSGKYKKTTGNIRIGNCFCALGVACNVIDPLGWIPPTLFSYYSWLDRKSKYIQDSITISACTIPNKTVRDLGLGNKEDLIFLDEIATLNDNGTEFLEIADIIEKRIFGDDTTTSTVQT